MNGTTLNLINGAIRQRESKLEHLTAERADHYVSAEKLSIEIKKIETEIVSLKESLE